VDGIVASNFIVQEDAGLALDAVASEHIKYSVRIQLPRHPRRISLPSHLTPSRT
jgi:hypothetical protein